MTVYILFEDDCETNGLCVDSVYATRELAESAKAEKEKHWGWYYIDEQDVIGSEGNE